MRAVYTQQGLQVVADAPPRLRGWIDRTWPDGVVTQSRTPVSSYWMGQVVGFVSSVGWRDERGRPMEQGEGVIEPGDRCAWPRKEGQD